MNYEFHDHGDDNPLSTWFQEKETWSQVPQTTITSHIPATAYLGWSPSLEFSTLHYRKQHIDEKVSIIITIDFKVSSSKNIILLSIMILFLCVLTKCKGTQ